MMGEQRVMQEALFYGFSLERHVPDCPSSDDLRHIAGFRKGGTGSLRLRLCGLQLMLQATIGDCLSFDPFAFEEDGLRPSEVDVGGREIG
jgi:hypothetical protein